MRFAAVDFPSAFLRLRSPATGLRFGGLGRRTPTGRRRRRSRRLALAARRLFHFRRLALTARRLFHFRRPTTGFRRFLGRFTAPVGPSRATVVQRHVRRSAYRQQFHRGPLHHRLFPCTLYDRNAAAAAVKIILFFELIEKYLTNRRVCMERVGGRGREGVRLETIFLCVFYTWPTCRTKRPYFVRDRPTGRDFVTFYRLLATSIMYAIAVGFYA